MDDVDEKISLSGLFLDKENTMRCNNCGTDNPEEAVYCFHCGITMKETTSEDATLSDSEENLPVAIPIVENEKQQDNERADQVEGDLFNSEEADVIEESIPIAISLDESEEIVQKEDVNSVDEKGADFTDQHESLDEKLPINDTKDQESNIFKGVFKNLNTPNKSVIKKYYNKIPKKIKLIVAGGLAALVLIAVLFGTKVICIHSWYRATCTKPMTCTKCHRTKGNALGHKWEKATCTEAETCSVCGKAKGIPLGHNVKEWQTTLEPTCIENGKKEGVCSRCNQTVSENIAPLGHEWGEWTDTKTPSCKEEGERQRQCARCQDMEKQSIPKTEHTKGEWKTIEESYVNSSGDVVPGTQALTCSVCGAQLETKSYSIEVTVSQKNAVKKAWDYLHYSGFSRKGLVGQLEFEGFSSDDAAFGVDQVGADWNYQAERVAKSYMSYSSFSRAGLIEQLKFEGFTQEQAEHGASSVGL